MTSRVVALLIILSCFVSTAAQAHFRCLGEEELEVESTAKVDSNLQEKDEKNWSDWYENLRVEFARRVNLVYASAHPTNTKRPTVAHLTLDVSSDIQKLKIRALEESEFSAFCKNATIGVLDIQAFALPSVSPVTQKKNLLLIFQNTMAISDEVKPQTLSSSDVNYLLRLDSNQIKNLLNLPSDQLRAAIDSGSLQPSKD